MPNAHEATITKLPGDATRLVQCPNCTAFKDSPDGSAQWTPAEIKQHAGKQKCTECPATFELTA